MAAQGTRRDAVGRQRADDGTLRGHQPRQQDERAEHGGDEEQQRQQVRELTEGLHVLVERDERRLVLAGLHDQSVVACQRCRGRDERRCLAAVAGVERDLLLRLRPMSVSANDSGANTTPNCSALVITSCCERAGQKYSVASPLPDTTTGCQPRRAEQLDRAARLQVEVVREVLLDEHLTARAAGCPCRSAILATSGWPLSGMLTTRDRSVWSAMRVPESCWARGRDKRCAGQARRVVQRPCRRSGH